MNVHISCHRLHNNIFDRTVSVGTGRFLGEASIIRCTWCSFVEDFLSLGLLIALYPFPADRPPWDKVVVFVPGWGHQEMPKKFWILATRYTSLSQTRSIVSGHGHGRLVIIMMGLWEVDWAWRAQHWLCPELLTNSLRVLAFFWTWGSVGTGLPGTSAH